MTHEFWRTAARNGGVKPALHPTLTALSMVLRSPADFSEIARIARNDRELRKHKFYVPGFKFPADVSDLLPPSADRWWEPLGKS